MAQDQPDWTLSAQLNGGTIDISKVITVDQITKITGAATVEVINKATTVIDTADRIDHLANSVWKTTKTHTVTVRTDKTYSSLLGVVTYSVATSAPVVCMTAQPKYTSTAPIWCTALGKGATGNNWTGMLPIASFPGETLTVVFYATTFFAGQLTVHLYGLTANPGVQLRSDGRAYPIGSQVASIGPGSTATANIIAAPASPLRILLQSLTYAFATTPDNSRISATINGHHSVVLAGASGSKNVSGTLAPEGGILLDPGSVLNFFAASSTGIVVSATYDLVV